MDLRYVKYGFNMSNTVPSFYNFRIYIYGLHIYIYIYIKILATFYVYTYIHIKYLSF